MSAPARRAGRVGDHVHLPSVHVRGVNGGFDYEEDLYRSGRGRSRRIERIVRLVAIERSGEPALIRETRDVLCPDEWADLVDVLPLLMDEGNPEAEALMEERGRNEFERQLRIARGEERACLRCGCSETRACSGGCIWASATLCSRCV